MLIDKARVNRALSRLPTIWGSGMKLGATREMAVYLVEAGSLGDCPLAAPQLEAPVSRVSVSENTEESPRQTYLGFSQPFAPPEGKMPALPSQTVGPPSHILGLLPPHPSGITILPAPDLSPSSFIAPVEKNRSVRIWQKRQDLVTHLTLPSANGLCPPQSPWQPWPQADCV